MRHDWEPEELVASWTLLDADWALVANKAGATRLGFGLLLKFFELEARFPRDSEEIPPAAVAFVADQVAVAASQLAAYDWAGRSIKYHRAQIREAFGFGESTVADEQRWAAWLQREVCPVKLSEDRVRDALLRRCRSERVEPPGASRIERVLGSARAGHDAQFTARTLSRLSDGANQRLARLVSDALPHARRSSLHAANVDPSQTEICQAAHHLHQALPARRTRLSDKSPVPTGRM